MALDGAQIVFLVVMYKDALILLILLFKPIHSYRFIENNLIRRIAAKSVPSYSLILRLFNHYFFQLLVIFKLLD